MHRFHVHPNAARAPFRVVRVIPVIDGHGAVRGETRERAGRADDVASARAEFNRLEMLDSDAIADGMFRYEIRDGADAPVMMPAAACAA